MLSELYVSSAHDYCRMAHTPVGMHGRQPPQLPLRCTCAETRVCLYLSFQLRVYRITWELLVGMACTPGRPCTATRARAMKPNYRKAAASTRAVPAVVGGSEHATRKDIKRGISALAPTRRGMRQTSHGMRGRRPCSGATSMQRHTGCVAAAQHQCSWCCQRPQTFGEGTILAPSRQIGSYRCVLGGCLLLISLSPVLERVDAAGADAPNVAYVDAIRVSASSGQLPERSGGCA